MIRQTADFYKEKENMGRDELYYDNNEFVIN